MTSVVRKLAFVALSALLQVHHLAQDMCWKSEIVVLPEASAGFFARVALSE
jgi:hypothetical protein